MLRGLKIFLRVNIASEILLRDYSSADLPGNRKKLPILLGKVFSLCEVPWEKTLVAWLAFP